MLVHGRCLSDCSEVICCSRRREIVQLSHDAYVIDKDTQLHREESEAGAMNGLIIPRALYFLKYFFNYS